MSPLVISRMRTTRIFSLPHYYRNRSMTGEQFQQVICEQIMNGFTLSSSLEWLRPGMGGPKVDCNQDHLHSLAPPEFRYGLFPETSGCCASRWRIRAVDAEVVSVAANTSVLGSAVSTNLSMQETGLSRHLTEQFWFWKPIFVSRFHICLHYAVKWVSDLVGYQNDTRSIDMMSLPRPTWALTASSPCCSAVFLAFRILTDDECMISIMLRSIWTSAKGKNFTMKARKLGEANFVTKGKHRRVGDNLNKVGLGQ